MRLSSLAALLALSAAQTLNGQSAPPRAPASAESLRARARAIVSGVVYDSLAGAPMAGATVQLVAADSSAGDFAESTRSDSLGRFAFASVPAGRYVLGFYHATLDGLGLEPIVRGVQVSDVLSVRADLAVPPARAVAAALCGGSAGAGAASRSGAVLGRVRDARNGAALVGAQVSAEWLELTFERGRVARRLPRRTVTTRDGGWYFLCDTPKPGSITLLAHYESDSTDAIASEVPASGVLVRDLYVGRSRSARASTTADATPAGRAPARRTGDARITGVVHAAETRRPLANATVSVVDGAQTRANELGAFTLDSVPAGTRTVEVRALGYYPARRAIDIVTGAPPLTIALATLRSVLDTMRVTARRRLDVDVAGFSDRQRRGGGQFLTASQIAQRQPAVVSELFRMIPGVYVELLLPSDTVSAFAAAGESSAMPDIARELYLLMRGTFTHRCVPAIYINGSQMLNLNAADLNSLVRPSELAGIEVYSDSQTPPAFKAGNVACGSIVIWLK